MDFFEMDELNINLVAAGLPLRVVEVRIEEAMSEVTRVVAIVANSMDIEFEPLLDQPATLVVTAGFFPTRSFELRLAQARFKGVVDQSLRWELVLHHPLQFLSLRKNVRKFRDQTTEAILSTVLDEGGITHAWQNTRKTDARPYTVQYRESDLAFVQRLLEFEGIYFTFEDEGTLLLGDASSSMPNIGVFDFVETESAITDKPGITAWKKGSTFRSGAASVNDYNWKTPSKSLLATEKTENDAEFETYEYPVGYRSPAQGKVLAKLRVEAHASMKLYAKGSSSVAEFRPGRIFEFFHAEAVSFTGSFLLVKVEHTFVTNIAGGKNKYSNQFTAIPSNVPFRPALVTPRPIITGNHTAMVRGPQGEEIHTDSHGRAKVQFHWDREANGLDDSRWIRVLQETSSSIVLSRVGWEASVGYIDGDPDRPMGLGRQINGVMTPTYSQPGFQSRMTIKTETYPGKQGFNELRMEDVAGAQFMDWHAQKDWQNNVHRDKTETIASNYTQLVSSTLGRTVEQNQSLDVGSNETKTIGKDFSESVGKDRNEKIGGKETVNVQNNHTLDVSGNDTEEVTGDRTTYVGSVSVDSAAPPELMASLVPSGDTAFSDPMNDQAVQRVMSGTPEGGDAGGEGGGGGNNYNGLIQRSVGKNFKKSVTANYMKVATLQINYDVGKKATEEITGVKKTTATEENITMTCGGEFIRTVTGDIDRKAKGRVTTSSMKSLIDVTKNMDLRSAERIEVRGDEIEITAESKFRLECQGLVIELTPDTIKIDGDTKVCAPDEVVITGTENFTL